MTEGRETEPQYFNHLAAHLRATGTSVHSVRVVGEGRDPGRVVDRAEELVKQDRDERGSDGFDAVWCVFDVDDHTRLQKAVNKAKRLGFSISVSNPCFEIWLLWHFADCSRFMTRSGLAREIRKHGLRGKSIPRGFPFGRVDEAIRRASRSTADVPDNPGSSVWRLAQQLATGTRQGR